MKQHRGLPAFALVATLVLVVVVLFASAARGTGAANQAATPATQAEHPIVGAWQWANNPSTPDESPSFAVFHADGTYVEFYPATGVGIGAWQATGSNTANLTIVFQDIDADPDNVIPGTSVYRISAEVDAAGSAITATGELEVQDASGTVVEIVTFTGTATRVLVEAPTAMGSPVATPAS